MKTYLLTQNPRLNPETENEVRRAAKLLRTQTKVPGQWNVHSQHITAGDRVLLLRQGKDSPGLIGSGCVTEGPSLQPNWNTKRRRKKPKANYVLLEWEAMVPPALGLRRETLLDRNIAKKLLNRRVSGTEIKGDAVKRLGLFWAKHRREIASVVPKTSTVARMGVAGTTASTDHRGQPSGQADMADDDTLNDLQDIAPHAIGSDGAPRISILRSGVKRDPRVRAAVRLRSGGKCEQPGCGAVRDFPGFLDVHHILGAENEDRVWSCVALCPNCHREAHFSPVRARLNGRLLRFVQQFR